ncbi:hypothetical protein [Streptomyces sp. SID12501]|uniref:hypothetical protein n=1 Tax=Streptomyces sp. SID12501 TaxID=2706042 RepID=UPI001EF25D6D|nr:hypothetical protein [Streptomyces sp. SID12501]
MLYQSGLGLSAEAVVDAGKDDEQLVAAVGGLGHDRREVGRLAGLNVANDEAASGERFLLGVVQQ